MARFAKVEAGRVAGIGQYADSERVLQNAAGEEVRERVEVIPLGCVALSDAEYLAMSAEIPDAAVIAAIIARATP